jgi:hypothetical protein
MGIELIGNENPFVRRRDLDRLLDVRHEILFRTSRSNAWGDLTSGSDFVIGDQTLCAMTNVFVFLAFDQASLASHARLHRFCFSDAFERLDASLFIRAYQMNALLV